MICPFPIHILILLKLSSIPWLQYYMFVKSHSFDDKYMNTLSLFYTLFIDQPSLDGHSNGICVHALKPAQSDNLISLV